MPEHFLPQLYSNFYKLLHFRNGPKLSFNDWNKYLNEIANNKKVDVNTIKTKLVECGEPGFTGETVQFWIFYQK